MLSTPLWGSRQHIELELPCGNFVDLRSFRPKLVFACSACSLMAQAIYNVLSKLFTCIQVTYSICSSQFKSGCKRGICSNQDVRRTSLEGKFGPSGIKESHAFQDEFQDVLLRLMAGHRCEQACSPFRHCMTLHTFSSRFSNTVLIHHFL